MAVLLESMRAHPPKAVPAPRLRGLWLGLCLLASVDAVAASGGKGPPEKAPVAASPAAKAGAPAAAASAAAAAAPVMIQPFSSPSSLPALGDELAQALVGVLKEAGIPAAIGKGDEPGALSGRVYEVGEDRIRLSVTGRGGNVQATADLEHLDDAVYAVFEQLQPRLAQKPPESEARAGKTATSPPKPTRPPETADRRKPATPVPTTPTTVTVAPPSTPSTSTPKEPLVTTPVPAPVSEPPRPLVVSKPPDLGTAPLLATPTTPTSTPSTPSTTLPPPATLPPPTTTLPPAPTPELRRPDPVGLRPRLAVTIVGEPRSMVPLAFRGLGTVGQQALLQHLQQRLRIPAVPIRAVGLVGGIEAISYSRWAGARHTLMVRLDTLAEGYYGTAMRTLSGRVHFVLLLDGRPLLDRPMPLPSVAYYPTEAPALVLARALVGALDSLGPDLQARLVTP